MSISGYSRAFGFRARTDLQKHRVAGRAVDQAMAVGDAGLPAGGIAGTQHGLTVVLAQHHLAFEDVHEFVLILHASAAARTAHRA